MNEADSHSVDRAALEPVLAEALAAFDLGGQVALEQFLAARPGQAACLREALADLQQADLLLAPRSELPTWFGEFRILEQLGQGGMGVVYLAEQTSLGRQVALKVVRPELLFFDGARERFRREIDAVARLEHAAIVPILATGNADGIPYYAMPRIRGRSAESVVKACAGTTVEALSGADLRRVLADAAVGEAGDGAGCFVGPWWRAVVSLVRQAALGIAHAHTRGILHRDLKPSNLMLTADGRAIVLDFGLAHASGDQGLTRTGAAAGSPAYMAPEQVRGEPADERTDVYGLAATLHCLLALRPPFDVADPEVLRSNILAGRRQDLRVRRSIPTELRWVLDTAMDVERGRRYASANAFAEDLQAVLDGRRILARRLPVHVQVHRLAARHRVVSTLVAALAVFVVVLPTVLLWQQQAANAVLSVQVRRSDHSVEVSIGAVENLLAAVAHDRMMHVPAAQGVAAEMLRGAVTLFDDLATEGSRAAQVHALRIRALTYLAQVEGARGRYDEAIAAAQRASDLCGDGELAPAARWERVVARRILAGLWLDTGRMDALAAMAKVVAPDLDVLAAAPQFVAAAQAERAHWHSYLAALAAKRDDAAGNEACLRDCVTAYGESGDRLAQASAQINLGQFLDQQQRYAEALPLFEAALAIATSPDVPTQGWPVPRRVEGSARRALAGVLRKVGREPEAIEAYRLTLQAFDQFLADYPEEPTARIARGAAAGDLALVWHAQRQFALARPLLEAACQDQLTVLARDPTESRALRCLVSHRLTLSNCLRELGDLSTLETVARELGAMPGIPQLPLNAARSLLRCADAASPAKATALRAEALELLAEVVHRGGRIEPTDALYDPLRAEPRFLEIASASGKAGG